MKIRNDFVTNSSSSSYIIGYKGMPQIDDDTLIKYPFLKNYNNIVEKILLTSGDGYDETNSGEIYSSKEEYDRHFVDYFGYGDENTVEKIISNDQNLKSIYTKIISYFEHGYKILIKNVDYGNTYFQNIIQDLAEDKENFIIIDGD